ncbi:MAG TPA: TonB-dependent receptor [Alphaproteobacteria bacterium]|nr:TonB-dependent receptor [Alphaproteobacteria bacterium]
MKEGLARFGRTPSRLALTAALALTGLGTATAQDQPAASTSAAPEMEEIVVTGSRIKTTDATAAQPLTVVSAAQIQQTEAISAEQFLMKLPSVDFSNGRTANANNGGTGSSQVGLRNLGPQRTLILVNGYRFPFTDYEQNQPFDSVDINNIPLPMIDHIEILRDGASSIYGADAIGGVINVVTKKSFNGLQLDGQVGETSYSDGLRYQVSATGGADFEKGNFLVNISHDYQDPITTAARVWAVSQHPEADVNNYDNLSSRLTGLVGLIGSGANQHSWYFPAGFSSAIRASQAYTLGFPIDSKGIAYGGGGLTPGDIAIPGAGVFFDFLPTQGLVAGFQRTQANFTGRYDVTDNVTVVMEGFYTNRQSHEVLNPEPLGYNVPTPQFPTMFSPAFLPNGQLNPYNPTNQPNAAALYGASAVHTDVPILTRRFENGPRNYTDDVNTYRFRVGLEGTVFNDYNWELGYFYGKSSATYNVANETNFFHLSQELGMNACGSAPGCSVANFFGYNTLTPAQAAYLDFTNTDTSEENQNDVYGNIAGPIPFIPELQGGPIKASVGFEYRTDSMFDHPDSLVSQGDAAIYSLPTQGNYATSSLYAEVNAPILKDEPFAKLLSVDVSARYDYNTIFGRALTHKVDIDWAVNDDIRFRATNSTGFRAPQLKELFAGKSIGEIGGADPCQPGGQFAGTAACLASIAAAGGTPANVPKLNQITEAIGGNPALHPEVSQEWTLGTVITPTVLKGFSMAVDYYRIFIRNEISNYDANQLLSACYGGTPYLVSQAQACAFVGPRTPGTASLGIVQALNANIGAQQTDGIDVDMSYSVDAETVGLPLTGTFLINGQANYLINDNLLAGGNVTAQAGTYDLYGGDAAEPRWKALLTLGYSQDNWSVSWSTRYYGGVKNVSRASDCEGGSVPCPAVGAGDYEGNEAAGVFYHDISATYSFDKYTVVVGVDNLFDKDPPFLFPTGQSNAAGAAGYDFVGRFVYMRASAKF